MRDGCDPPGAKWEEMAEPARAGLRKGKRDHHLLDAATSMFEGVITKD
jgi:hypothetical protein